jgi:DNA-binding response OmpR family regulator
MAAYVINALVIEDDATDKALKARALEALGTPVHIVYALDGEAAIRIVDEHLPLQDHFSVVILDMGLPRRSGLEVLAHVRQADPGCKVPVIAVAGASNPMMQAAAGELGICAWIVKPMDFTAHLDVLSSAVRHCLELVHRQ